MLELIPTVRKDFSEVFKSAHITMDFPIAEFGISIGFFLILTVEQIIHVVKEKPSHGSHGHSHGDSHGQIKDSQKAPLLQDGHTPSYGIKNTSSHHDSREGSESEDEDHPPSAVPLDNGHQIRRPKHQNVQHIKDNFNDSNEHEHEHSIFADINKKHHNQRHYLRSYLLLIALSVHALFEGLAVGLFQNMDSMVELLGALIIHKCILAFSIGINLVQHSFPAMMVARSSFLFSAMSPVGLGIGILMLTYASSSLGRIFSAIFQAIATGTFLYVTFFEIFFHELNSKECHRMLKVLMMTLGYSLVAVVQYFENSMK
jgi:zinc transporter 1/2/3